ncbi:hypothetical protein [Legionella shakespearei]|uniref:Uncharacterized protein n=1 Tax=Legionella shakespearei DSM 23087 TaxID=1122169 RepID=A0A0W0YK82_9GAMM|nr:hypothetical protein [Legionella shakespearei]KTD57290.1 hypothetical protein Lsha_2672 [Legionella shakespearei DSM 23087]
MTLFEKEFLLHCVNSMIALLSDEDELQKAVRAYMENRTKDLRFKHNSAIPLYETWTTEEALNFSAAVFESTARANIFFCTPESVNKVSTATKFWSLRYVPLLALDTNFEDRLESIKSNCFQVLDKIEQEVPDGIPFSQPQATGFSLQEHPYAFFSAVTAGVVIVAAATAAVLKS